MKKPFIIALLCFLSVNIVNWYDCWLNAEMDINWSCKCIEWYTYKNSMCVKKQNNVYFHLETNFDPSWINWTNIEEMRSSMNIIRDQYWNRYRTKIDPISCNFKKLNNYEWWLIVVNLWYDFTLDVWDRIIMQDDDDACDITSVEEMKNDEPSITCRMMRASLVLWNDWLECSCENSYSSEVPYCINLEKSSTQNDKKLVSKTNQSEIDKAIEWMYFNDLTMFKDRDNFNIDWELTREQASKFFVVFNNSILGKEYDMSKQFVFDDLFSADSTLQPYITLSTTLWLFKWTNGQFLPNEKLTQAQAIAVLIRSKDWFLNETSDLWYASYYLKASEYWLIDGLWFDVFNADSEYITRGQIAIMLYRLSIFLIN